MTATKQSKLIMIIALIGFVLFMMMRGGNDSAATAAAVTAVPAPSVGPLSALS